MPSLTRRRALHAAVGVLAGLGGCNDETSESNDPPTGTPAAEREPSGQGYTRDPESVVLRADGGDPRDRFVWFARDPEAAPTDGGTVASSDRRFDGLIADQRTAETFTITEGVSPADVSDSPERVREFVTETDFETQTLFVDTWPVQECYRLELCYVDWSDDELASKYGKVLRDHDVHCDGDERDSVVIAARLPAVLDPDEIRTGSTSVSGSGCSARSEDRRVRSGETPARVATTARATDSGSTTDGGSGPTTAGGTQ